VYSGIRFLNDGIEAPEGSRKFSLLSRAVTSSFALYYEMAAYTGTFAPSASPTNVTYALNGYMEYFGTSTVPTFRFDVWQASEPNYNWGRESVPIRIFIKN